MRDTGWGPQRDQERSQGVRKVGGLEAGLNPEVSLPMLCDITLERGFCSLGT